MLSRFQGERGKSLLIDALVGFRLIGGDADLARAFAEAGVLVSFSKDQVLIQQADDTNDVFLLVSGTCSVIINGRHMGNRGPGDHVGEMAAIQPTQPRSASIIANDEVVALKLSEAAFSRLADQTPRIYKSVAQELARRLLQRNASIGAYHDKIKVFVICSVEALPVARIIENAFEHDAFSIELWNEGCFKVANYTIKDLEAAVDSSDFAIAIAHADDVTESRYEKWPAPRDNVIFELGLFMGRLGVQRAILMEPRETDVKLPSDMAGITTVPYRFEKGGNNAGLMGPACNRLRSHFEALGPFNG